MSSFGIIWIIVFILLLIGAAIYDVWKLYADKPNTCEHMYWIDGDEELFCIRCGAKRE